MRKRQTRYTALVALTFAAACADPVSNRTETEGSLQSAASADRKHDTHGSAASISVLDDCDPRDQGWAPTGGCALASGRVEVEEFNRFLTSGLSLSVVGHPAWRNEPSYLPVVRGTQINVTNDGGRFHTFTRVARFGGGRVPPLNQGLTTAPECALPPGAVDPAGIAPGASLTLSGLANGRHRYMCCIHPWMRALVKVTN
jgi:plastocyanin